jgi:DNA repair exonuclease SbcCD ATPase subunit
VFEDLLRSIPASELAVQRRDFTAKASISRRIACEPLIEQEKANKKLVEDHQKLSRNFKLSRAAKSDLEKKVSELAEALKKCQDEKKIAEEAAENSRKDLEKLRKTHDDDLRVIENLRKDHDKSLKTAEDLRTNNADLAKSLSSKDLKIQDLERALTEQREASGKKIFDIIEKLKLLFEEYERSLNEFGVRPAPLPADLGLLEFMEWIDAEFKALPEVISGANDFVAAFSVESILKLLHDFDCADLAKFREKLPQFPDALSTSRLRPNEDVQAIRSKFAREFWLASGKEAVKSIASAKLAQVNLQTVLFVLANSQSFVLWFFLHLSLCPS